MEGTSLNKDHDGSFVGYLAAIMADGSNIVFTGSLSKQNRTIVPLEQLKSATAIGRIGGSRVLQVSESTVLKVGRKVNMDEAETLLLLAAKTNVPVPKVHTAYTIGEMGFILMSKVEGRTLASCLEDVSREELREIALQLKSYVLEWRELRNSFLGSVDGGPCRDIIFKHPWDYMSTRKYGSFYSFEQYKHGVVEALRLSRPTGVWYEEEEELKDRILSFEEERSDSLGVMTHGDLHPGNIIIKDGSIEGIVDWGEAGYSIPGREFFAAKRVAMDPTWIEMIDSSIPCFEEEYKFWDEIDQSMKWYSPV
ncbi:kinase-like protein [Aspergillus avenaceus]|uniref:Kinase-like protein n=1 Tax=Aspergillus avenaceus TaxID=36643 RepID=A0A5N6U414_ASPAV|nr:kinase-like protein [Aspergillus avenaceus]